MDTQHRYLTAVDCLSSTSNSGNSWWHGLSLGTLVHDQLRSLIIETGGLSRDVIGQIVSARLPELEHLEIWTGNPEYGADSSVEDVRPFFESSRFPKLKYLGIKNCDFGDELAALAVSLPILLQVEILDFSMGAMSDAGAEILLKNSSHFASLKKLDLGENMLTAKTTNLFAEFPCEVSTDGQREGWVDQQGNVHRYPAVGE